MQLSIVFHGSDGYRMRAQYYRIPMALQEYYVK